MALSLAGTLTDLNLKAACYNVGNRQHGILKLTILADEPNRSEKKARQIPASANESLITWLLHLLEVDWGHPQ